jgi:hypothetical protein
VVSSFGAMFAVDQERAASEMIRVCRRGRQVGLANWTPEGFVGQLFRIVGKHAPQGAAVASCAWGTGARLAELFGAYGNLWVMEKHVSFRSRTLMGWIDRAPAIFPWRGRSRCWTPPGSGRCDPTNGIGAKFNRATDSTMLVNAEYLEVVITRR